MFKKIRVYSHPKSKAARARKQLAKYRNADGTKIETSIERKVREWLEKTEYHFTTEYRIKCNGRKARYYDFYINNGINFLLIECDGWFHGIDKQGNYIPESKLTKIQKKNKQNDKVKDGIAKKLGIPLIRVKESDIKNNFEYVKRVITEEINRQKNGVPIS